MICGWSAATALLLLLELVSTLSSLMAGKREAGDTLEAGVPSSAQSRKPSVICRWSVTTALLLLLELVSTLSSLMAGKREAGDTLEAGVPSSAQSRKPSVICRWSVATAVLLLLDLLSRPSSLRAEKGEAGDTLAYSELLVHYSSLKAKTSRREKPATRLVHLADTEAIRDLRVECCNRAASAARAGVYAVLADGGEERSRRYA